MKKFYALAALVACDILCIFISFALAIFIRNSIELDFASNASQHYAPYLTSPFIYVIIIGTLAYHNIYTKRFDFWHESYIIFTSCVFSCIMIFFLSAINKDVLHSRFVFLGGFTLCVLLMPMSKFFLKKLLYRIGIWQKKAKVINSDKEFRTEIFKNHYLGYKFTRNDDYETIFIASKGLSAGELNRLVEDNMLNNREVIFTPMLDNYDFAQAKIFSLFNSRTNLFMVENSLLKPINSATKRLMDLAAIIMVVPLLVPIFAVVIMAMKISEPHGSIFFSHPRMGRNGKIFSCLKFRSMRENCDEMFKKYLEENPHEIEYYQKYHKYKNDIRTTKLGDFLRKTSIDELPQLINVLKGDMSIVGPRPVTVKEFEMGDTTTYERNIVLKVRPGVTGLAQINNRDKSEFGDRIKMNIWYVKNWSIYFDIIIIIKTIKLVLLRESAS